MEVTVNVLNFLLISTIQFFTPIFYVFVQQKKITEKILRNCYDPLMGHYMKAPNVFELYVNITEGFKESFSSIVFVSRETLIAPAGSEWLPL